MATASFPGYNPVPGGVAGGPTSGEAFILGSGMNPLQILRQQDALAAKRQQYEAALKAKQQAQEERDFSSMLSAAKLDINGYLPFKNQIDQSVQATRNQINTIYHDPKLDRYQQRLGAQALADQHNSLVHGTNEIGKRLEQVRQTAQADPRYNKAALTSDLYNTLKDADGNTVNAGKFNPEALNVPLTNAKNYDETQVVKKWLADTFAADQSATASAARPGGYGRTQQAASNFFLVEDGRLKLDPKTHQPIPRTELPEVQLAAENDSFLKGLLDLKQQQYGAQLAAIEQKTENGERLSVEEHQLIGQESLKPKTRTDFLNELLLPHAYQRTSDKQTYSRPVAPKTPKAAPKQSATEIVVTPTVSYQASAYMPEVTGRFQQMKRAVGITPSLTTNHYPTVGVTFASASKPYAEVTVDNKGAEVVGQDGKTTTLATGNGKVPMQVVSRDYVLYVNGKRVGRKESFGSDSDAYQYLISTIDNLTPEQARKAELRAEYRGTLNDKARVGSDGAGGQAQKVFDSRVTGQVYFAENRQSVIVPASQAVDAQLERASGGNWNARQVTPQQSQAIEALTRKGGRVVNPYTTTDGFTRQPQSGTPNSTVKTTGSKDVLGFGSKSPEQPYKAAGKKPSGVDWGRGGKYYQAPNPPAKRSNTGGLY